MLKILPALEGYVVANIATQNLFNANPMEFLLGDLNQSLPSNPNALQLMMGPTPTGAISLRELLMGQMSQSVRTGTWNPAKQSYSYSYQQQMTPADNLTVISQNFMDNMGNIIVGTALSTAGFRVAKKILRKPVNMANRTLRNVGLGTTVQF